MMRFESDRETARAAILAVRYLPLLVRASEEGVERMGLKIEERLHFVDAEGNACPMLRASGAGVTFRLGLRSAFEDFLTLDREADPVRVDPRLEDDAYAKVKLADVVDGRLSILKILVETKDVLEAQKRLNDLSDRFEWLRTAFVEGAGERAGADVDASGDSGKPTCRLVGTDGNVFSIIARVRDALRSAGQTDRASEFVKLAFLARSYDEVLRLAVKYVEVI